MENLKTMKKYFKAVRPVQVSHERGTEFLNNVCGEVIKVEKGRVYLHGLCYDFNISTTDFENFNVLTK